MATELGISRGIEADFRCCQQSVARHPSNGQNVKATSRFDCMNRCRDTVWCVLFTWESSDVDEPCFLARRPKFSAGFLSPPGGTAVSCSRMSKAILGKQWPPQSFSGYGDCSVETLVSDAVAGPTTEKKPGIRGAIWYEQNSQGCTVKDVQCVAPPGRTLCASSWKRSVASAAKEAMEMYPGWQCNEVEDSAAAAKIVQTTEKTGSSSDVSTSEAIGTFISWFVAIVISLFVLAVIAGCAYGFCHIAREYFQEKEIVIDKRVEGHPNQVPERLGDIMKRQSRVVQKALRQGVSLITDAPNVVHVVPCSNCGFVERGESSGDVVRPVPIPDGVTIVNMDLVKASRLARERVKAQLILNSWRRLTRPERVAESAVFGFEGSSERVHTVLQAWGALPDPESVAEASLPGSIGRAISIFREWARLPSPPKVSPSEVVSGIFRSWKNLPSPVVCPEVDGYIVEMPSPSSHRCGGSSAKKAYSIIASWARLPFPARVTTPSHP